MIFPDICMPLPSLWRFSQPLPPELLWAPSGEVQSRAGTQDYNQQLGKSGPLPDASDSVQNFSVTILGPRLEESLPWALDYRQLPHVCPEPTVPILDHTLGPWNPLTKGLSTARAYISLNLSFWGPDHHSVHA